MCFLSNIKIVYTIALYDDEWLVAFYMVSYFLIMTLLFGNLFFGLLLSVFGSLYEIHKSGHKLTRNDIQKAQLLDEGDQDDDEDGDDNDHSGSHSKSSKGNKQSTQDIEAGSDLILKQNIIETSSRNRPATTSILSTTIPEADTI